MWLHWLRQFPTPAYFALFLAISFPFWCNAYLSPPDSASYLAVPRTLIFDGDLDFRADYDELEFERYLYYLTENGRISNDWPVGSGVVWLPPFLVAHGIANAATALGIEGPRYGPEAPARHWLLPRPIGTGSHSPLFEPNGKSGIYKILINLWTAALCVVALSLACAVLAPHVPRRWSVAAGFLVLLGTPVGFYTYAFALMSHIPSMLAGGLLLWYWNKTRENRLLRDWAILGGLAGLAAMIRPQDGIILVIFLVELFGKIRSGTINWKGWFSGTGTAAAAALLVFSPQAITWWCLYGNPLQLPKVEEMHWFAPRLVETLFSEYHGILSWSPVLLLLPLGLYRLGRRDAVLAWAVGIWMIAQVYLNAANEIWWSGGSFGNRRMVACGVGFVIALAPALATPSGWLVRILALLMAGWNLWLWAAERAGRLSLDHYVPWNTELIRTISPTLLPWDFLHSMLGDFAGFGWVTRILVMAGALGIIIFILRRPINWGRIQRIVLMIAGIYLILIPVVFFLSALRTPRYTMDDFPQPIADRNLSLFNGYYEYGFYSMSKGRIAEAEAAYLKATDLLPGHPNPWRYLGTLALDYRGDAEQALVYTDRALERNPYYGAAFDVEQRAIQAVLQEKPWRVDLIERLARRLDAMDRPEDAARVRGMLRR